MINVVKLKNYGSYFFVGFLPLFTFVSLAVSNIDFLFNTIISIIVIFISIIIARRLSYHKMRDMIEGNGFLVFDISSKGVIKPYIAVLKEPYVSIKESGISSLFQREQIFSMELPKKSEVEIIENGGKTKIVMEVPSKEKYFSFEQFYPVFLINSQTKTFYDKSSLGEFEEKYLTRYNLNYIKLKVEELSSILRDFARYVVELSKPTSILKSKWLYILLISGLILILLLAFFPQIINIIGGSVVQTQPQQSALIVPR